MIKGASLYALEEGEEGAIGRRRREAADQTDAADGKLGTGNIVEIVRASLRDFSSKSDARRARAQFATEIPLPCERTRRDET